MNPSEPVNASKRSLSIDALRALAAFFVLFHHCYVSSVGLNVYQAFLDFFRDHGRLGVDFFFVLSGFCIHWGHSKAQASFDQKNYLLRRWWRIYPPYFFALALAVFLNLFTNYYKWKSGGPVTLENFGAAQIFSHLFLVHNFFPSTQLTVSGPFWTIAVEAQLYLIYLFARPLFFDRRGWIIIFSSALLLHVAAWTMKGFRFPFDPMMPFRYWIEWVVGAYLVYQLRKRPLLTSRWILWLILCVLCWIVAFYCKAHQLDAGYINYSSHFLVFSFAFLILVLLRWEGIWLWTPLKWIPFFGSFSYSIYLIHFLILDRVRTFILPVVPVGMWRVLLSFSAMFFSIYVSFLFFKYFEKPFSDKSSSLRKV